MHEFEEKKSNVRIKVWGRDQKAVLNVLDHLRRAFSPNCDTSRILQSGQGGYHAFVNVYFEGGKI